MEVTLKFNRLGRSEAKFAALSRHCNNRWSILTSASRESSRQDAKNKLVNVFDYVKF
jgi:hypothetical protein